MQPDQWYLDVKGKKYGPYTWVQIQKLYKKRQIIADDKITAPHMQGKWVTLREFLLENPIPLSSIETTTPASDHASQAESHSHEPKSIPPRPDEKSMTGLLSPKYALKATQSGPDDPIVELFDVYQAAHERKPIKPSSQISMSEVVGVRETQGSSGIWFRLLGIIVLGLSFAWGVKTFINKQEMSPAAKIDSSHSNSAENPPNHIEQPAAPPQTAGISAAHASTTPPAPQPVNHPRISLSRPPTNDAAREREREAERDREREADRERERELEREREREAGMPADNEREGENEGASSATPPGTPPAPLPPGSPGTPGALPADYHP